MKSHNLMKSSESDESRQPDEKLAKWWNKRTWWANTNFSKIPTRWKKSSKRKKQSYEKRKLAENLQLAENFNLNGICKFSKKKQNVTFVEISKKNSFLYVLKLSYRWKLQKLKIFKTSHLSTEKWTFQNLTQILKLSICGGLCLQY